MKKDLLRNLTLMAMLSGVIPHLSAQATAETVTVTEPGTLSTLIDQLPSTRIQSLTVKGTLNAADIACLRKGAGKLVKTESLDISEITLVPGEESYGSLVVERTDVGMGKTTQHYYISDEYYVESKWESTGLGGTYVDEYVYCNDLSGAFGECPSFKSIKLPKDLPGIGSYMFFNNNIVEEVELPDNATYLGTKTFKRCTRLKGIALPDGIDKIPEWSFGETALEWISFSEKVDTIGDYAFLSCPLKEANLANVKYVGESAFSGNSFQSELNLANLDTIKPYSFHSYGNQDPSKILNIKFSDKLKLIEEYAFSQNNIKHLALPESLERIGINAFASCVGLETVDIPESLLIIASGAFDNTPWSSNLKSENGVVYIGSIAYRYDAETAPDLSSFSFKDGTTSISGGAAFFPWYPVDIRKKITQIELPASILYIGDNVFESCINLEEINLPDGLKEIGANAFYGCEKLWIDCFPETLESIGEYSFYQCSTIPDVILPESLKYIGWNAFRYCNGISKVTLNSYNLKIMDEGSGHNYGVFANCNSLEKLVIGSKVQRLPSLNCNNITSLEFIDIENSCLEIIENSCFYAYKSLIIDRLPGSIKHIGDAAFSHVTIRDLNFHEIEYIGSYAFWECAGIKNIILPEKTITIGNDIYSGGVFAGCPDLEEVIINSSDIILLGKNESNPYTGIFENCAKLSKVIIGKNVRNIPYSAFKWCKQLNNVVFEERPSGSPVPLNVGACTFNFCNLSGNLSFPAGLELIEEAAFADNHISSIELPSTCRELDKNSFIGNNLISVKLNDGITKIGQEAISGNFNLNKIDIPATCEEIGLYAFDNCSSLSTINMFPVTPPSFGKSLGRISDDAVIYVPAESLKAYKAIPALSAYEVRPFTVKAESITLNNSELTLTIGETVQISATVLPEDTTDKTVAWTSSNSEVATVDADGFVTAISAGTTTISSTCGNLSATCAVSVTANSGISDINSEDISVTTTHGTITINGAAHDDCIKIMRGDGTLVYHGSDKTVSSLSPGYYIVTINNTTFKTAVH